MVDSTRVRHAKYAIVGLGADAFFAKGGGASHRMSLYRLHYRKHTAYRSWGELLLLLLRCGGKLRDAETKVSEAEEAGDLCMNVCVYI